MFANHGLLVCSVKNMCHWVWGRVFVPSRDTSVYSIDYNLWPGFVLAYGFDLDGGGGL
jgi:hypothetical protein